jgi:type IV secretory pathway VirB2 component (pilin)
MTRVFLMPEVPSHPQTEVPMKASTAPSVLHPQQKLLLTAAAVALILSNVAHGAGAGMPWETPLNNFLTSLTGPVAKIAGVAAVVLTGLGMAFSEGGSGMRKLVTVAFGLTIAFAATTFFLPLFGYAGGAAF